MTRTTIALGIDIGGTRIKAGYVDTAGRVTSFGSVPTPASSTADFSSALRALAGELAVRQVSAAVAGVGIGCKGIIDHRTTRIEVMPGRLSFVEGETLSEILAPVLADRIPVRADNDARTAMAGEHAWGAARGCANAVMLTLGTGLGGAAVVEGRLLRGAGGVGGHLGHVTVNPDGPPCICGSHGCLEAYFSAHSIEAEAFAVVHRGCDSLLTERFRDNPAALTCEAVFRAAADGDPLARHIVDRAARILGAGIAGLLHVFDPEIVVLGGQIAEAGEPLFEPIRKEARWRTRRLLRREVPIVPSQVVDHAGIVGAAALILAENR